MLTTTQVAHEYMLTIRTAALALATAALVATVACGDEVQLKEVGDVTPPSTSPVVVGSTDTLVGMGEKPVVQVSLSDAEKAYQEKRFGEATELFAVYADQHPKNPWGHYMFGLSAWKSGDLGRAESAFVKSLELDRKHVKTLLNLTRVHLDQGRPKEARERVTAAIALDSTSAEAYRLMGRVRAALNQPNEAIASYRVALSRDPSDVWSMNNLGLLMIQQGRYEEALGPLARAVQLDSNVAMFHNNLGIALEHTGRYVLAVKAYQDAVKVDVGYTKAKLSLARVEGRTDDPSVMPIDLAAVAHVFDREVRGVQVGELVPRPDPVTPPQR